MISPEKVDLLFVDDDDDFRSSVVRRFQRRGFHVSDAPAAEAALELASRRQFDVAVIDMMMPGISGIQLLERLKASQPECEVIMLTGQGSIESAVQAMKLGAYDYLRKPVPLAELEVLVEKAYDAASWPKRIDNSRRSCAGLSDRRTLSASRHPCRKSSGWFSAGPTDKAILIQGESGTGKELIALRTA